MNFFKVIAEEAFATLKYVYPAMFKWCGKKRKQEFFIYPLHLCKNRHTYKAQLYLHGPLNIEAGQHYTPLLFIHGDYSHPCTLLPLAEIAINNSKNPIFSLYIHRLQNYSHFEQHATLVDKAIDKIEDLIKNQNGLFDGIYGVGHSKGALLLVERQFSTDQLSKIIKTFAVAGPLRAFKSDKPFKEPLKTIIDNLYQRISTYHDRKFFQIIPKNDWLVAYESMAVRPNEHCYVVPGMHLSGLYTKETSELFKKFLSS